MAVRGEKPGTRELNFQKKGITGTKTLLCDWSDIEPVLDSTLPVIGTPWSAGLPYLQCVDVVAREGTISECEYVCRYSTGGQLGEDFYEWSLRVNGETLDRTKGYRWRDAGTPVTVEIPTIIAVATYAIKVKQTSSPLSAITAAMNKVNSVTFHGFEPGTLRFDGADTSASYDSNGLLVSVQTIYEFTWKPWSHNLAWREPEYKRWGYIEGHQDLFGEIIKWHDTPLPFLETDPYVTSDPTKLWMPIPRDGITGIGAWDTPEDHNNNDATRYGECDFATVLGLPNP